jgi:hypothetical protein
MQFGGQVSTFFRNLFYPEDGGNRFLQNAVTYLPNYMASHPRRPYSSYKSRFIPPATLSGLMYLLHIWGTEL